MIGFDEAFALVVGAAQPLASEKVALDHADGRVLAADVVAQVDSPPADVAAMDGYAVRDADAGNTPSLRLIGASYPGVPFTGKVGPGNCVRIFTGAAVPTGADRVVVQEITEQQDDIVRIVAPYSAKRHIRPRGSDFGTGDRLLPAGHLLEPRALVAAAAADLGDLSVWRRPRLSILGTGDELATPGTARQHPGHIPESVSFGVAALARMWGAEVIRRQRVRDDPDAMRAMARDALATSDLVVMTGGASVGEKDFAKSSFAALGLELLFARVAIKPGKPVWFGRAGDKLVLGLPGNPTSALVTARLLLAPLIAGLAGRDPRQGLRWRRLPLAAPLPSVGDRETFVRGRQQDDSALPLTNQDSGAQHTLAVADLLIRRRAGAGEAQAGELVDVLDF